MLRPVVNKTSIDGIPVFWTPLDGVYRAGIGFRCGMADERITQRGITHLIEHLALFGIGRQLYGYNGVVNDTTTLFYADGNRDEVHDFLRRVCSSLTHLPLDRLEVEKKVLRAESGESWGGYHQGILEMRFGLRTYASNYSPEYGLRDLMPQDVTDWAAKYFTRENAVVWMSGSPPATLDLDLKTGTRVPPPDPVAIDGFVGRQEKRWGREAVVITLLAQRSAAIRAFAAVAEWRLYDALRTKTGMVYSVDVHFEVMGSDKSYVVITINCGNDNERRIRDIAVSVIDELASTGPSADELARYTEHIRRGGAEPQMAYVEAYSRSCDELVGYDSSLSNERIINETAALTPGAVASVVNDALDSSLLVVPRSLRGKPAAGFVLVDDNSTVRYDQPPLRIPDAEHWIEYASTNCSYGRCTITSNTTDMYWRAGDGSVDHTVKFKDLVAVIEEGGGRLMLLALDGTFTPVSGWSFDPSLLDHIRSHVAPDILVRRKEAAVRTDAAAIKLLSVPERMAYEVFWLGTFAPDDVHYTAMYEAGGVVENKPGLVALAAERMIYLVSDQDNEYKGQQRVDIRYEDVTSAYMDGSTLVIETYDAKPVRIKHINPDAASSIIATALSLEPDAGAKHS